MSCLVWGQLVHAAVVELRLRCYLPPIVSPCNTRPYIHVSYSAVYDTALYSAVYVALNLQWNVPLFAVVALLAHVACNVPHIPPNLDCRYGHFLSPVLFGAILLAIGCQFVQWRHSAVQPCTSCHELQQAHIPSHKPNICPSEALPNIGCHQRQQCFHNKQPRYI